jgi:type IV pilus assembly protein PilB
MPIANQRLKEIIKGLALVSEDSLNEAYAFAEQNKKPLGEILVKNDLLSDDHVGQIIADEFGYNFVNLNSVTIKEEILNLIPAIMAKNKMVIAFERDAKGIKVAMADPEDLATINLLRKKIGENIIVYYATPINIESSLSVYQKGIQKEFAEIIKENISAAEKGAKAAEDVPIIKIVDSLIEYAYQNHASDVHIEPEETKTLVRFRVDGILHDIIILPKVIHDLVVTRIKILSKLRTDEHRSAQDGKLRIKIDSNKIDIRISILPILEGEKVVMRLLSEKSRQFGLEDLGLAGKDLIKVNKEYSKPYGMVLATGPTGCGKTTTMYAILKILNRREVNISTIEDPVEYDIEGVNQIQVNVKTNLTFANGLRSILRQDPDIIMVGEIRDQETADIAINAAMTGHLVLSTLHANDSATVMPRFLEMGIEPFLVASTINLVIAQRLVRKICRQCIVSKNMNLAELKEQFSAELINKYFGTKEKSIRIYHGEGCSVCNHTGFIGRVGIYEVMSVSVGIRQLIMKRANADEIRLAAIKEGMTTMIEDGISKVMSGITTIDEILRATRE